jgi:putative chitinase
MSAEVSVQTALDYWKTRGLNQYADKDDVTTITKKINGGLNGFDDRKKYLSRAKTVLKDFDFIKKFDETTKNDNEIILAKRGEKSQYVKDIQSMLIKKGAKIVADGDFGMKTEAAVKDFQRWSNLSATGMVDKMTLDSLMK